jgi:hypothetical protein
MRRKSENKTKFIEMKTNVILATAIIGFTALASLAYAEDEESENKQKVAMTELPAAVQKTIQDNVGGETVTETAKETKGGKTYYEAEVQKSGGEKVEIKVAHCMDVFPLVRWNHWLKSMLLRRRPAAAQNRRYSPNRRYNLIRLPELRSTNRAALYRPFGQ